MKKFLVFLCIIFFSVFLAAVSASAVPVYFTDTYYQSADGQQSFYSDKDSLTLNAYPQEGGYLTWYADDGIGGGGTAGYEEDEWEYNLREELGDYLNISFDSSVLLTEIYLTDFFYNEQRDGHLYAEIGIVAFLDGFGNPIGDPIFSFSQDNSSMLPSTSNGEYTIDVSSFIGTDAYVKDVYLAGIGYNWIDECIREDHEFAVAGINTHPIPEPATMLLLGSGLVGLAGFRRKLKM